MVAAGAWAQLPPQSLNTATTTPDFIKVAAISDRFEIEEGQLAATHALDPRVRQLGRGLAQAHMQTTAALNQAVRQAGMPPPPPPALDPGHVLLLSELAQMQGMAFDNLYLEQQAEAHEDALMLMRVYAAQGDAPALRQAAATTIPMVADHLSRIQALQLSAAGLSPPGLPPPAPTHHNGERG
jgi:putative membrane protein